MNTANKIGLAVLPEHFFDEHGRPRWHLLNARFGAPMIIWNQVIGGVPVDEDVVYQPTQELRPPINEELKKLRDVIENLEKFNGGVK